MTVHSIEPSAAVLEKTPNPIISATDVDVFYGDKQALHKINLDIHENGVTSLIGPSGVWQNHFPQMH